MLMSALPSAAPDPGDDNLGTAGNDPPDSLAEVFAASAPPPGDGQHTNAGYSQIIQDFVAGEDLVVVRLDPGMPPPAAKIDTNASGETVLVLDRLGTIGFAGQNPQLTLDDVRFVQ